MMDIKPINQTKLFGLSRYLNKLINLYQKNKLPNKLLLSGQKGLGKSTMAHHFINSVLSKDEEFTYNNDNFEINLNNHSFKTMMNKTNLNFSLIDINHKNKSIDINQIRDLISTLNKSSLNHKPRFILIDNIEFLNANSINALLKIIEEPSDNTYFILINNNKKVLDTLLSRCINFKIFLTNQECLEIANILLDNNLKELINEDLINYYSTPGNVYNLVKFGIEYKYDLKNQNLKEFLIKLINNNDYKKDSSLKYLFFDLIEFYFNKIQLSKSFNLYDKYSYFMKKISDTKKFNLDEESLFIEFEEKILNG